MGGLRPGSSLCNHPTDESRADHKLIVKIRAVTKCSQVPKPASRYWDVPSDCRHGQCVQTVLLVELDEMHHHTMLLWVSEADKQIMVPLHTHTYIHSERCLVWQWREVNTPLNTYLYDWHSMQVTKSVKEIFQNSAWAVMQLDPGDVLESKDSCTICKHIKSLQAMVSCK